jgi:hypothetical protein
VYRDLFPFPLTFILLDAFWQFLAIEHRDNQGTRPIEGADMKRLVLSGLLVGILVCAAVVTCHIYNQKGAIVAWDSPRMLEIKAEWELLDASFRSPNLIDDWTKHYDSLAAILKKHLSNADLRRLVATSESLPACAKDRSDFANAVLEYMAVTFVHAGDHDALVRLFSTRFPDYVEFSTPIEFELAVRGEHMGAPILILGEAYSKCQDVETRRHLGIVLRRAFIGSGISGNDEADFVKNAMRWYAKEKDHLVVSTHKNWPPFSYDHIPEAYCDKVKSRGVWEWCKQHPLFVKPGTQRAPSPGKVRGQNSSVKT